MVDDPAFWHRAQFAFTVVYHYLFPQLTMGLAWFIVFWKWRALKTGETRHADALTALRSARARAETYDLIFIDPPYDTAHDWAPELSALLPPLLGAHARVVVESDRRMQLELGLDVERERRFGDTTIRIHRRQ